METQPDEVKDLLVPEPLARSDVSFNGRRLEENHVAPVHQGSDICVNAVPIVRNDGNLTLRRELPWDSFVGQKTRRRIPGQSLCAHSGRATSAGGRPSDQGR